MHITGFVYILGICHESAQFYAPAARTTPEMGITVHSRENNSI